MKKSKKVVSQRSIELTGVQQNNLKDIDVKIPLQQMTVVCGPSGSGKSSLAFETLFAEGQRRYIESLSSYARQFLNQAPKPKLRDIKNIPPAIALEQKNSVKNSRSTVGTTSEVLEFLRLLFSKIGQAHCPNGHGPISGQTPSDVTEFLLEHCSDQRAYLAVGIDPKKSPLKPAALLKVIRQEGYLRLLKVKKKRGQTVGTLENFTVDSSFKSKDLPKSFFYIVVDRCQLTSSDQGRLTDSIQLAYQLSAQICGPSDRPEGKSSLGKNCSVITTEGVTHFFTEASVCNICHYHFPKVSSQMFSFNSPVGACSDCNGFGNRLEVDEAKVVPNPQRSINEGAIHPFTMPSATSDRRELVKYCKKAKIDVDKPWEKLSKKHRKALWEGTSSFYGVLGLFEYLETKKYKMHVRVFLSRYKTAFHCKTCDGMRLKPFTKHILVHGHSLHDFCQMDLGTLLQTITGLPLTSMEKQKCKDVLSQLISRLTFLVDIGVQYLTLNRLTKSLSGGEFQRLLLAKQLGMGLSQTLYVLDEPTIGLHPRDNDRLISQLKDLKNLGNTLVVVEHDHDVIASSDHIIEMGPGSGYKGGEVVFSGAKTDFLKFEESPTTPFLTKKRKELYVPRPIQLQELKYALEIKGCQGRNLQNVSAKIPLNRIVTVTGVSGSGKSTFVTQTLYPALKTKLNIEYMRGEPYKALLGEKYLTNVLYIDQSRVGKTARSNLATYLKVFDIIRDIFADQLMAKSRNFRPGTFSLNVKGGRCPDCKGLGYKNVDMVFMDDIQMECESCKGSCYRQEVLEVRYKKLNIRQVLDLTVAQAMDFFVNYPSIRRPLSFLNRVGLEYLTLGQSTTALSGGESQRLKIAKELFSTNQKGTLYILDEPTTGLHFREVNLLMAVIHNIVDSGGSVILIEHNLEVMAQSDYIIDLGPEAGQFGGKIVAHGTPEQMTKKKTHTGTYLKKYLADQK